MSTTEHQPPTTPEPTSRHDLPAHPDIPVLGPLTGSWTRDCVHDQWWWSDEMFAIHGFAPGDLVPTTEIVLRHKHPDDRQKAEQALATAHELGAHFSHYHRIIDAHSRERHVLTVGHGRTDEAGRVVGISGYMVDLTDARRRDLQPTLQDALDHALVHRGDIDMAKGALMLSFGIGDDEAFAMLRAASNDSNLKLNRLAHRLVREMAFDQPRDPCCHHIHELLQRVTSSEYLDE